MITQYDIPWVLKAEMPAISGDDYPARIDMTLYKSIQYFSDYTRHAIQDHNFVLAKKCFHLAESIYRNGDNMVKNAIENNFVFSFTSFMPHDRVEKLILKSIIPVSLYTLYIKQVMGSSC
jgi:hypothetical protein